jgi:hypothetical protein
VTISKISRVIIPRAPERQPEGENIKKKKNKENERDQLYLE